MKLETPADCLRLIGLQVRLTLRDTEQWRHGRTLVGRVKDLSDDAQRLILEQATDRYTISGGGFESITHPKITVPLDSIDLVDFDIGKT